MRSASRPLSHKAARPCTIDQALTATTFARRSSLLSMFGRPGDG
jgi:hypothetical protein